MTRHQLGRLLALETEGWVQVAHPEVPPDVVGGTARMQHASHGTVDVLADGRVERVFTDRCEPWLGPYRLGGSDELLRD